MINYFCANDLLVGNTYISNSNNFINRIFLRSSAKKWYFFANVYLTDTRRDVENVISITNVLNNNTN